MNLLDYKQVMDALEKERQMFVHRGQYGAEDVICHNAINVISELPVIRQPKIIRCVSCVFYNSDGFCAVNNGRWSPAGFCSMAVRKEILDK